MYIFFVDVQTVCQTQLLSLNIATQGIATQISDFHYVGTFPDPDYAFYAIDGDFSTGLTDGARCAIMLNSTPGAWWQVDLKKHYVIESVAITTRKHYGMHFI